jgi:plasmid stabilization system protein ParE
MADLTVSDTTKQAWIEAVVTRCGCDPATFNELGQAPHTLLNQPCPIPRAVEDRGVVAYYHRNPLKRLTWRILHRRNPAWRPS